MLTFFRRLRVARQLLLLTFAVTVVIFGLLITVVNHFSHQAAVRQAETALRHELGLLSSILEFTYQTQITTAKRRMGAFKKLLPGKLTVAGTSIRTGETDDIPVVKAGTEVMNNNLQYLQMLKQINTGEGFILAKKGNEYVRVATLLKDDQGKSQVGKALKPQEPQVAALDRGQDFIGLVQRNGKIFMSIYEPILDDSGKVVGAYGLRSSLDAELVALRAIIKELKVGETGYFYAFSDAGNDIGLLTMHPSKEGKTLRELFDGQPAALEMFRSVISSKGGVHEYLWPNPAKGGKAENKLTVFGYSKEWGWYFGAGTFLDELTQDAIRLRNVMLISMLVAALLIGAIIYLAIANRLKPLKTVVTGLSAIGSGDLSVRLAERDFDSENELDVLARQLNQTSASISQLVNSISETSEQLASTAIQLDRSSNDVATAAQHQSDAASSMAASVEQFSVSINQVADLSGDAAKIVEQEHRAAQEGGTVVADVKTEMEAIAVSVERSSQLVDSLGRRSAEIEGITRLIQDVADQINMLALNAAIEAARAGEAGRGFSVVADEVRKLAERTAEATSEISRVIHGVRSETEQVVDKMHVVAEDVNQGVAKVNQAGGTLESIHQYAQRSSSIVGDIAAATKEQSLASNDVARRLESVAQMAEETAAVTAQNRVAVASLGKKAAELQSLVKKFRL